ncbi:hypothetical protein SAMN04488100_1192 [Alkalibacterium putridalgicola]|uniref:Uncharacterized protein n=1 Tax=Alkalibacterium putridalgicola TaxID=426703 RepID=A0A1H7UPG9_9LACT|nr:hypothetical protein [Alkalibacterium putridalgicola]GEK88535.1 hypothetical protein APU01nite_05740 [Alkalibacterium putridalgicola]SEL98674.1 hypothetical protein SAMN04488100_1192 [Alkalibacterium putridalgicola]
MGLFDFFKSKKDTADTSAQNKLQDNDQHTLKHEMQITEKDLKADEETVDRIVEKMVEEDPFKNFYSGKTKEDMTPLSKQTYKYENITTVNVDFVNKDKGKTLVKVEGISLGFLPEDTALTLQSYQDKYLLTAFVYVTGGPYMAYDPNTETVIEDEGPFGLDIFVQFT